MGCTFIWYSCTKYCYVPSRISHEGHNFLIPVKTNCTSDCCYVTLSYTRQLDGSWDAGNPTYDYPLVPCDNPTNPSCPSGTEYETDCIGGCPVIY